MSRSRVLLGLGVALAIALPGCGSPKPTAPSASSPPPPSSAVDSSHASATTTGPGPEAPGESMPSGEHAPGGWCVDDPDGRRLVSGRPGGSGNWDLCGPDGKPIGKVKVEADRVKIKDPADQLVWTIKSKEDGCAIYDATSAELVKAKREAGGWRLKNAQGTEFAKVKPKEAGAFKVYDAAGLEIGKIKPKTGGSELEDTYDKRLLRFRGELSTEAGALWGVRDLDNLQKAGLTVWLTALGGKRSG